MASLAPLAAPSAPVAPPRKPPPVAPPVCGDPFGRPLAFTPSARAAVAIDDNLAPLAPLAVPVQGECCGGGGEQREPEAAGPNEAVQFNDFGRFAGTPRFAFNVNNSALFLNGSMYFDSNNGGTLSALNGLLNIAALTTINIASNAGGINMQVGGPNVINISTAATGFVAIQGVLYRPSGVGVTYTNYPVTVQASPFKVQNSTGSVVVFSANPQPAGGASPINMQGLPTNPTFLAVGDIWNNNGILEIWRGTEAAGRTKRRIRSSGFVRWFMAIPGNLAHWGSSLFAWLGE